jgi:tetratricopeptide (TPR) repeat protein
MVALSMVAACRNRGERARARAVNDVILVTIDTWRADAAGFAGNREFQTPFLDSLAGRGILFRNAHAHNVVTLPSHVNILTGLLPYQHGVRDNAGFVLAPDHPTIARTLRQAGFTTAAFVAAFPLDRRFGLARDFDLYDDSYGKGASSIDFVVQERPASAVLEPAAKWWSQNEGRPRFLWVHLYDPHAPYVPSYPAEVSAVDGALAKHLGPLLDPDTLLIVTSDHGEALGDHGELTHGLFAYEGTLKVPLIVAGPSIEPRIEDLPVRHIDIVPTILDACGLQPDARLPGSSLLAQIGDRDTYFESLSASLNRGWAPLTGLLRGSEKYIELPIPELYDLRSDPREMKNVREERRRSADALRRQVASMTASAPRAARSIAPEEAARLRSLGYVAGSAAPASSYSPADDPKNLIALDSKMHNVIDAYEKRDLKKALVLAKEVVAERPAMPAGRELLAFVLQQNEQIPAAIEELKQLVESGKGGEDTKARLGLLLSESGRAPEAIALLEPLVQNGGPDTRNAFGIALADHGELQRAEEIFRSVLSADPNNAPALQNLGIVALRTNDVVRAKEHLHSALALNPRLPLALNTLGVIAAREGDLQRALTLWRQALELDPALRDARENIAIVERRLKQ